MENNIKLTAYKCPSDGTVWSGNNVPTSCPTCGLDSAHCPVVDESATIASADAQQSPVSQDAPTIAPDAGTEPDNTATAPDTMTPPAPETK